MLKPPASALNFVPHFSANFHFHFSPIIGIDPVFALVRVFLPAGSIQFDVHLRITKAAKAVYNQIPLGQAIKSGRLAQNLFEFYVGVLIFRIQFNIVEACKKPQLCLRTASNSKTRPPFVSSKTLL